MDRNNILKTKDGIYRILKIDGDRVLAIDCKKKVMPKYYSMGFFDNAEKVDDNIVVAFVDFDSLSPNDRRIAQQRFTMIASVIAVVDDENKRVEMICYSAQIFGVSKATIRNYLCTYLVSQNVASLAPKKKEIKEFTSDQKNMRWALNKFFYTQNKNSLSTAYTMMLKEKYCNTKGELTEDYPTFNQFRYFYRKTRKLENFYIKRDGIKDYQRNRRPLLGDGVQEFAPCIGTAMLDSTICDIYLVDEKGQLVGRPLLVAACDANTSLCLGYSLLWEGGTYSLQNLMLNILEDKVTLCEKNGISIVKEQWDVDRLPGVLITDGGSEYKGQQFSQITELGVSVVNLSPYRPDLKGTVEKLFDLIQNLYKDVLKGKGVIMPDYQERGAHDYREDAILTLSEFERIVVRCIIYYNCRRVVRNYPYTSEMLEVGVNPYANEIWNYKKEEEGNNLISVSKKDLILALLPRTTGKFTRFGLKVNHLRYYAEGYTERFLEGGDVTVSYNPDNCGKVWIKKNDGTFTEFSLIESRYDNMSLSEVKEIQLQQRQLENDAIRENYAAKIELLSFIETVSAKSSGDVKIKGIRKAKRSAKRKLHRDIGGELNE